MNFSSTLKMCFLTILKHPVKCSVLTYIEGDRLTNTINLHISGTYCDRDFKFEANWREKEGYDDRLSICNWPTFIKTLLLCAEQYTVLSLSSNTQLWIVCEHLKLQINFWPINLIKYSAQRLNFPWKFSCLFITCMGFLNRIFFVQWKNV